MSDEEEDTCMCNEGFVSNRATSEKMARKRGMQGARETERKECRGVRCQRERERERSLLTIKEMTEGR
jgi:hypothetical protein